MADGTVRIASSTEGMIQPGEAGTALKHSSAQQVTMRHSRLMLSAPDLPDPPRTPQGQEVARAAPTSTVRRVLVVDDNEDAAECLCIYLSLWGKEALKAVDGPSALRLAAELRPDAVVMDIRLPGMNGWEVAQRIRQMPGMEGVVLVALTGLDDDDSRARCREAGFDRHLVKPAEATEVQAAIEGGASGGHLTCGSGTHLERAVLAGRASGRTVGPAKGNAAQENSQADQHQHDAAEGRRGAIVGPALHGDGQRQGDRPCSPKHGPGEDDQAASDCTHDCSP
jgi:CheY-like chemotaxis protein